MSSAARLGLAVACVLAAVVSTAGQDRSDSLTPPPPRVVLLPLKDLSPDAAHEWIALGVGETLDRALAAAPGLAVIERGDVLHVLARDFAQADGTQPETALQVARHLQADRVVCGTYAKADKTVTFRIRVVDVASGLRLATESLEIAPARIATAPGRLAEIVFRSFDKAVAAENGRPRVVAAATARRIVLNEAQHKRLGRFSGASAAAFEAFARALHVSDPHRRLVRLNEAIRLDDSYAWPYVHRAIVQFQLRKVPQALADFNKAIQLDPSFAKAYNGRAVVWVASHEFNKALADLDKAIALCPAYAAAYRNRAEVYRATGRLVEAIRDCDTALRLNPGAATVHNTRGLAWANQLKYDRAMADFNRAIELDPKLARAYKNRASIHVRAKRHDEAIADYTAAIGANRRYAQAYYYRAVEYARVGKYDQAWDDVRRCKGVGGKIDPSFLRRLQEASGRKH